MENNNPLARKSPLGTYLQKSEATKAKKIPTDAKFRQKLKEKNMLYKRFPISYDDYAIFKEIEHKISSNRKKSTPAITAGFIIQAIIELFTEQHQKQLQSIDFVEINSVEELKDRIKLMLDK